MQYRDNGLVYSNVKSPANVFGNIVGRNDGVYTDITQIPSNSDAYIINAIDINWNNVGLFDGININTTADFLNIINTILAFIDIVMSVNPKSAYVYIGSINDPIGNSSIKSLLLNNDGSDINGEPFYHLKDEINGKDKTSSLVQTYMKTIAKRVEYNVETVCKNATSDYGVKRQYAANELLCYIGPAEFIQKSNHSNKSCIENDRGDKLILRCIKQHSSNESSIEHGTLGHNEDQYFTIDGVKYIIALTMAPSTNGKYKVVDWI